MAVWRTMTGEPGGNFDARLVGGPGRAVERAAAEFRRGLPVVLAGPDGAGLAFGLGDLKLFGLPGKNRAQFIQSAALSQVYGCRSEYISTLKNRADGGATTLER